MQKAKGHQPGAGEVVKLGSAGEDDEPNLSVAKNGQLLGLLHQTLPSLGERHLPAR
ncbi:unnamed protein product, partial [Linum tenue]